jgi:hypothetical protein
MKRQAFALGLVCVLHGSMCSRATAQGFNVRHDAFGWTYPRAAYSLEMNNQGQILVFGNGPWFVPDTNLMYSSIASIENFNSAGVPGAQDTLFQYMKSTFVGWHNCSTVLPNGKVVLDVSTAQNDDTARTCLYWFDSQGQQLTHVCNLPIARSWICYQHKNTPDGGFIITGVTDATGLQDIFLLKTDSVGQVEWWQTYGHPTRLDYSATVDFAPDGGYYIGGNYPQTLGNNVQWILRTDVGGELLWEVFRGIPIEDGYGFNAATTTLADGNTVYACGRYTGLAYNTLPELVKLDTSGGELWDRTYGFAQFGTGFFVVQEVEPFGDLIACGQRFFSNGMGGGYSMGTLLRTTSEGDSLWMYDYAYFDSTVTDCEGTLRDVQATPDGGFVAVGTTYGAITGVNPPGLSQDVWVIKVDSMGCIEPGCNIHTGITSQITNLRDALRVWPNPVACGGEVTVQVTLPEGLRKEALRVSVVSSDGKLVEEQSIPPQTLTFTIRTSNYVSGLYHLHLSSGSTWVGGTKLIIE